MKPRSWRRRTTRRLRTRRLCKPPGGLSSAMDETRIEFLTANHERGTFDCGKPPLNAFIRQHAAVNHERGVSRVYVVVRGPRQQVLAYCASSAGTFLRDHLPPDDQAGLPRYPLPTAHLGRLAVDLSCRGQRLGELLLFHFLRTACDAASGSACSRWTCSPRMTTRNASTKSTDSFRYRTTHFISICRWQQSGRCSHRRRRVHPMRPSRSMVGLNSEAGIA
jgi:hypothetical protein